MTFADSINEFNKKIGATGVPGMSSAINLLNPYLDDYVVDISSVFYKKYFSDNNKRKLILGINPGKSGAGVTGIPFTDTKNLKKCGFEWKKKESYEVSSVFIYDLIAEYGGVEKFYKDFFISNVCPLGFTKKSKKGRTVNINYYDFIELLTSTKSLILDSLKAQIDFGIDTKKVFCLGNSENFDFLYNLNQEYNLFGEVVPLPHPRYIIQYKLKEKQKYIRDYLEALRS